VLPLGPVDDARCVGIIETSGELVENLQAAFPRDAALLENLRPEWQARYPGLRIRSDAALAPGDCQVRSRFGLTDARLGAKLSALTHSLTPT